MARHRNKNWDLSGTEEGGRSRGVSPEHLSVAVLMDIREALQALRTLLACPNFIAIPRVLREIRRNTTKPKRKAKP